MLMQWKISSCRRLNDKDTGHKSYEMWIGDPPSAIFFACSCLFKKLLKKIVFGGIGRLGNVKAIGCHEDRLCGVM